ncbi:MAG: DUF99 domain-containing protein [Thermoprotei archaeon]|nr:MAG: DUF99 domain-containing protein [Thermoprotei archaeon]
MTLKTFKPGYRVFGIAECFRKTNTFSIIVGVSYRRDRIIDGVYVTRTQVGGLDATQRIIELVKGSGRKDINVILLNGCIISWFNIVDIEELYEKTGIPVICVSYEESEGLEKYIREYFPGDNLRLSLYKKLGERKLVYIKSTGKYVYIRSTGLSMSDVRTVLNAVTFNGKVPEPLRIAQMVARSIHDFLERELGNVLKEF